MPTIKVFVPKEDQANGAYYARGAFRSYLIGSEKVDPEQDFRFGSKLSAPDGRITRAMVCGIKDHAVFRVETSGGPKYMFSPNGIVEEAVWKGECRNEICQTADPIPCVAYEFTPERSGGGEVDESPEGA